MIRLLLVERHIYELAIFVFGDFESQSVVLHRLKVLLPVRCRARSQTLMNGGRLETIPRGKRRRAFFTL
jgi:hypothetical protein